jgi:hypothetical protein
VAIFQNSEQFYDCIGALMERAKVDPEIGPKIAKSNIVIRFIYSDPDAITTVNAKGTPSQPGVYVDVYQGESSMKADIVMSMKADIAHHFWLGKVNLVSALAKGDIKATGPIPKILKLLPAVTPLYKQYPELLKDKGLGELINK